MQSLWYQILQSCSSDLQNLDIELRFLVVELSRGHVSSLGWFVVLVEAVLKVSQHQIGLAGVGLSHQQNFDPLQLGLCH